MDSGSRKENASRQNTHPAGEATVALRAILVVVLALVAAPALALDRVTFGTNWFAQPEHGGFYQAAADGTYARFGLEVTILPGGPQKNNRLLLATNRIEFFMGENLISEFSALSENIPIVSVAAIFQKDPLALMSHPQAGFDRFEDLAKARLFVGFAFLTDVWPWLESKWRFDRKNLAPYAFNSAPFIADVHSAQQGFVTSEPYAIARSGGFTPNVFLLADYGYDSYSTLIQTRRELIDSNPDLVRRFVEASIIGWAHYLNGDNGAANAMIKAQNPEMDDGQIAFSIAQMKAHGIVESGDTLTLGIGAMQKERIARFYSEIVAVKMAPAGLDLDHGFDLRFVNHGLALERKSPEASH
jgi:NitT/TauT family transport system substrate-binding protein